MKTQTVMVAHQHLLTPLVDHSHLPQTGTATKPADPRNFGTESFTDRAWTVSVVREEILDQRGHAHGGIND